MELSCSSSPPCRLSVRRLHRDSVRSTCARWETIAAFRCAHCCRTVSKLCRDWEWDRCRFEHRWWIASALGIWWKRARNGTRHEIHSTPSESACFNTLCAIKIRFGRLTCSMLSRTEISWKQAHEISRNRRCPSSNVTMRSPYWSILFATKMTGTSKLPSCKSYQMKYEHCIRLDSGHAAIPCNSIRSSCAAYCNWWGILTDCIHQNCIYRWPNTSR